MSKYDELSQEEKFFIDMTIDLAELDLRETVPPSDTKISEWEHLRNLKHFLSKENYKSNIKCKNYLEKEIEKYTSISLKCLIKRENIQGMIISNFYEIILNNCDKEIIRKAEDIWKTKEKEYEEYTTMIES